MIATPEKSLDHVKTFTRNTDGAQVACFVSPSDVLHLVVVEYPDGEVVEIDPDLVDINMLKDGLGTDAPHIL